MSRRGENRQRKCESRPRGVDGHEDLDETRGKGKGEGNGGKGEHGGKGDKGGNGFQQSTKHFLDQREAEHDWVVSRAYAMFARSYIDVYGHVEYTSFAAVALQEVAPVTSDSRVPSVLLADARHRLLASGTSLGTCLAAQPSTVSVIALSPLALSIVQSIRFQ